MNRSKSALLLDVFFQGTSGVSAIMLVSPVFKRSFFLCFLLAGRKAECCHVPLGKTISFTLRCPLKPYVPFNKLIIHSTERG